MRQLIQKLFIFKAFTLVLLLLNTAYIKAVFANEHNPHIHGVAELTIAIASNKAEVSFIAPADSLFGFEHKATSHNEIAMVNRATQLFTQPKNLLTFEQGVCKVSNVNIDTGNILDDDSHEQHHIDDDHHSEHKHHTDENHQPSNDHAEITISYQFDCSKSVNITSASINIFSHFQAIETINVFWLNETKQGSTKISAKNNNVKLK